MRDRILANYFALNSMRGQINLKEHYEIVYGYLPRTRRAIK